MAQTIENRALADGKGLLTHIAQTPLVFLTMNLDVAFSSLTSRGTSQVRAKLLLWVHWLLARFGRRTSLPVNPVFRKIYPPPRFSGVLPTKARGFCNVFLRNTSR